MCLAVLRSLLLLPLLDPQVNRSWDKCTDVEASVGTTKGILPETCGQDTLFREDLNMAYGHKAKELGMDRFVDNTYLFEVMCRYFGISHRNPSMNPEQAIPYLKTTSADEWQRHLKRHISRIHQLFALKSHEHFANTAHHCNSRYARLFKHTSISHMR